MEYEMGIQLADNGLDKRRKRSAIRRNAIKFTKVVSLVGIRHATDASNSSPRRLIWVAWLVFGFGFAIYQIQDRIDYYCRYPSVTEFRIVLNETLLLPQITVCNENQIMTSKAKKTGFHKRDMDDKLANLETAKQQSNWSVLESAKKDLDLFLEQFHTITRDWQNLSKSLSQTAEEAIIGVYFNEESDRSLIEEVITDAGHCFAFSTKKRPLYSTKSGSPNGLTLVLSVSRKDYDPGSDQGFKMLIHDSEEIPRMKEGGLPLKPGFITRVEVSLEDVMQQGPPYGSCKADEPDYKVANCLAKADYETFVAQCECRTMDTEKPDVPICSYAQFINCTVVNKEQFLNASLKERECDRQCHSRIYKTSLTETAFPMLMNDVSTNIPCDAQILDRIRVHVYYSEMSYMEAHNEAEYSFLELLCDIGGALSLLLGATLLTVYEAGEFFLLFARDYLHLRFAK